MEGRHGLRKTTHSAGKRLGLENRRLRALPGHDSDRNLEVYLDGVDEYAMARDGQDAPGERFGSVLSESTAGANHRRWSGVTGRAAAKTGVQGEARRRGTREQSGTGDCKRTAKCQTRSGIGKPSY
ncbi:MAG: hypothetical protein WDN25_13750 [Acetobacteraceae bacterium]